MTVDWTFRFGDLSIVVATLLGPVLAVQAQKWVERHREKTNRRISIFRTLMATRANMLLPAHVEALNAIPIEFYGTSKPLQAISNAWKIYLDYLNQAAPATEAWGQKRVDLFNDLLEKISNFCGYKFTSLEIRRGVYFPTGHAQMQTDQEVIRQGLAKLFRGEISLPMDVKSFPADPQFIQNQTDLHKQLSRWLNGDASVKVELETEEPRGGKL